MGANGRNPEVEGTLGQATENNNIIFQAPTSMRTVAAGINIKFYDEYGDLEDAN